MTGMTHPILGDSNIRRKLDQDDRNGTSYHWETVTLERNWIKMTGMAHPILGDSNLRKKLDQDDRNGTSYIGRQ